MTQRRTSRRARLLGIAAAAAVILSAVVSFSGPAGASTQPQPHGRSPLAFSRVQRSAIEMAVQVQQQGPAVAPHACAWAISQTVVARYVGPGQVKVLVSVSADAASKITCPNRTADFIFNASHVTKNAHRVGISKSSDCHQAYCTFSFSAALWFCDDGILCQGYYAGEGAFFIGLTSHYIFASAPRGCRRLNHNHSLQCDLFTRKAYVPPEI